MTNTDAQASTVAVARGEMQAPWSDFSGNSYAAGGPLLTAIAGHLGLSDAERTLIVGPHSAELVRALAEAAGGRVTVLVRGVTDAEALAAQGLDVDVVAGALDGFAESAPEPFDVVVALDGLDRATSYDSGDLSFAQVMALALGLLRAEGRAVIAHSFDAAPVNLLDARVAKDRFADDEFRPFHSDPTRPTTPEALIGLTEQADARGASDMLMLFGPTSAPRLVVAGGAETLDAAPDGLAPLVIDAARAHRRPLLAQPDEMIRTFARGHRLGDAADGAILLFGTVADFDIARVSPGGTLVVAAVEESGGQLRVIETADVSGRDWPDDAYGDVTESDTAQPSETARYLALQTAPDRQPDTAVEIDLSLLPEHLVLGPTLEEEFVRLAELGDVPAFRELAAAVGSWVQQLPVSERRVVTFDNLHIDGRDFRNGSEALGWSESVDPETAVATAFWLLEDRLRTEHLRQPWPDHVQGESLVTMWTQMAIPRAEEELVREARGLADAVHRARPVPSGKLPDLRTAFADVDLARKELGDAQGQIFGLERTIGFRDKQLRTREQVIRNLRGSRGAAAVGGGAGSGNTLVRMAKRTAQVRSVGELTAGVDRVIKRTKRNRAAKSK